MEVILMAVSLVLLIKVPEPGLQQLCYLKLRQMT